MGIERPAGIKLVTGVTSCPGEAKKLKSLDPAYSCYTDNFLGEKWGRFSDPFQMWLLQGKHPQEVRSEE